jgi:hypothetical protein
MIEDSPAPFIIIRTPQKKDLYERALEIVGLIHDVVERAPARFHMKDRLDRSASTMVFELSRAKREIRSRAWKHYRRAHELGTDITTILDILEHQSAITAQDLLALRTLLHEVLADLVPLATG